MQSLFAAGNLESYPGVCGGYISPLSNTHPPFTFKVESLFKSLYLSDLAIYHDANARKGSPGSIFRSTLKAIVSRGPR